MRVPYQLKQKRSGIWFVEFEADVPEGCDRRRRVSTNTRDYKKAKELAPAIVEGNEAPSITRVKPKAGQVTLAQLFERCQQTIWRAEKVRSQATLRSNIKILNTLIGNELVIEMTAKRLKTLVEQLGGLGYKPATIDRKMSMLSAALTFATEEEDERGQPWLLGRPKFPKIVIDNFQDRVVSAVEETAIFSAIIARSLKEPTRDWDTFAILIQFLIETGCRLSEALNLTEDNVESRTTPTHGDKTFALFPRYSTKNKKPRQVILTDNCAMNLASIRTGTTGQYFRRFSASTAWYMWCAIREDVSAKDGFDITDVKIHTFRHTCLTRLARSGRLRLEQIADWAGHSDTRITRERYAHLLPEDMLPVLDVITDMIAKAA